MTPSPAAISEPATAAENLADATAELAGARTLLAELHAALDRGDAVDLDELAGTLARVAMLEDVSRRLQRAALAQAEARNVAHWREIETATLAECQAFDQPIRDAYDRAETALLELVFHCDRRAARVEQHTQDQRRPASEYPGINLRTLLAQVDGVPLDAPDGADLVAGLAATAWESCLSRTWEVHAQRFASVRRDNPLPGRPREDRT